MASENDIIFIGLPVLRGYYYFKFPLRQGDRPRECKITPEENNVTFIVRRPQADSINSNSWIRIFSSPEIEILENKSRTKGTPPLRWGLTHEEKQRCFKIARDALKKFLSENEELEKQYFNNLPARLYLETDLDVALWVDGRLRGSAVVERRRLGEGIAQAAILSSRDARFKPLALNELPHTRVEMTIMHDLHFPLSRAELSANRIYPEKGYMISWKEHRGWYLPEVFNVLRFKNLEEFLGDLAEKKTKLDRSFLKKTDVFIFEVDDFVESHDLTAAISLWGSMAKYDTQFRLSAAESVLKSSLRAAADWLCNIQESDGNIPPITDPLTGRQTQIDWPRLAFCAWALAEFGEKINEAKYSEAAIKSFEYLRRYLLSRAQTLTQNYELTLAYFGQLALALGQQSEAKAAAEKISARSKIISFEPLRFAQIASFLKIISRMNRQFSVPFENLTKVLKENFEKGLKDNSEMNLAVWAELVNTFNGIDDYFSGKVADWLKAKQLPSGAFPESTSSDFIYTRGSSKILEVLALEPEKNKKEIEKVLAWLMSMQYTKENTFLIPKEIRPKIIGSFRHDYFNPEAWIDSAGHMLLTGARLL